MDGLLSYAFAFFVTVIAILVYTPLSHRIGLLDAPDHRKQHQGAIPLIGGIGMFTGLMAALPFISPSYHYLEPFIVGTTLILIIGVIDDIKNLSARVRFTFQIAASLIMIYWADIIIFSFDKTFYNHVLELGIFAIPFTVFAIVGAINALNMSDGVDGLAGSISATILIALCYVAYLAGAIPELMLISATIMVVIAYLLFNFPIPGRSHAKIFMGDGGSMTLGFIIAWFSISLSQGDDAVISPVTVLWVIGLPVIDTISVMTRRVIRGRSPFAPDREHFHHILLVAGFSRAKTVMTMVAINALLAIIGITADQAGIPEYVMFYIYMALLLLYFWGMMHAWRVMQVVKRLSS